MSNEFYSVRGESLRRDIIELLRVFATNCSHSANHEIIRVLRNQEHEDARVMFSTVGRRLASKSAFAMF